MLVHEVFESQVLKTPAADAIKCGEKVLDYKTLNSFANQIAQGLIDQGVKKGDFVAICMDRSPCLIASLLGVLKAGAAYVPLDPEYPVDRLRYMLEDSDVRVLLVDSAAKESLSSLLDTVGLAVFDAESAFSKYPDQNLALELDADQYVYMIYTSGSTGKPKGSLVYHKGFSNLVDWYKREFNMGAETQVLHMTSPAFDLTQKNVFAPLLSGGCLCLLNQRFYDTNVIVDHIQRYGITVVNCTPSAFSRLLSFASTTIYQKLSSLRFVVLGGEPIVMSRLIDWLSNPLCSAQVVNSYGPTECTDVVSAYRVVKPNEFVNRSVPIGNALPGFELRIVDDNNQKVAEGIQGQIAISGVGVGGGYYNNPELTALSFVPDPEDNEATIYLTGDAGRILEDGSIDYLGRIDNQVKVRGFRIELGEIERSLEAHEGIREAACSTYKDLSGDNKLSAYLVYVDSAQAPKNSDIRQFLQKSLPDFMMPTAWVELDKLPLSPNGKLDRKQLPDPNIKRPTLEVEYKQPEGEVQLYLSDLWLELLGLDRVGVNDKFFELGGSSLNAVDFVARISAELGERIPIASFFGSPTLLGFEQALWLDHSRALKEKFPNATAPENSLGRVTSTSLGQNPERTFAQEDIAIIGMSGRFPGAGSVDELWSNLLNEVESVRFATDEELRDAGVSEDDIADPDYVRAYFSMDDVEYFDAEFFGYQPGEVVAMDPQHRLFLELAWSCLDNAGYAKAQDYPGAIGVFGGVARDAYLVNFIAKHKKFKDSLQEFSVNMGNDKNFPASRVSYKFGMKGPAVNVQTACSSSGVALHLACQSLLSGDSDMALVGGCRVLVPTKQGYRYVEGSALSQDGHLYAFDSRGSGMVRGSGGAFVLVKRLSAALKDGDCIRAVIKSTAINNDGSEKAGYTAPSVEGQSQVILDAIRKSGVDPETIAYIETHGTSTALGDPIEIRALTRAYRQYSDNSGFCRVGSLKTNIGHLDAGAAMAGLIKTVMAIETGVIPASLNYACANKDIDFASSPFFVNDKAYQWEGQNGIPRRAGVSSFGLGGTNFHTIIEAAAVNSDKDSEKTALIPEWEVIALSAKSINSLNSNIAGLFAYAGLPHNQSVTVSDLAYSLNSFRPDYQHRALILLPTKLNLEAALGQSLILKSTSDKASLVAIFQDKNISSDLVLGWLFGSSIDWSAHFCGQPVKKIPLPSFQFFRKRFWADLDKNGKKLFLSTGESIASLQASSNDWADYYQHSTVKSLGMDSSAHISDSVNQAPARSAVLSSDNSELEKAFRSSTAFPLSGKKSVIMMFPGGGAQYVGMGKGLYDRFELVRDILDEGFTLHQLRTKVDLKSIWFAGDCSKEWAEKEMLRPSIQLPALFLIEYALAKLWQSWGVEPDALVGHSAGENTAACIAGVMTFSECLELMTLRGELFERVENSGMLSINLSADEVQEYLGDDLDLATINAPEQSTVSGRHDRLQQLKSVLDEKDIGCQIVPINIAAHSRLLDPILNEFSDFAATLDLKPPSIPFVTNLTGDWITDELATNPEYFSRHLRSTVRFADNATKLLELEQPLLIECGPGKILSSLFSMQTGDVEISVVSSLRHMKESVQDLDFMLGALGNAWSFGASIQWHLLQTQVPGAVFVLPAQPPVGHVGAVDVSADSEAGKPTKVYDTRLEYIVDTICSTLYELSGIPVESLNTELSFLELGFDSLFLTQANLRFKKAFSIKLSLRQLLRDAPSISKLAVYIDDNLPIGALANDMSGVIAEPKALVEHNQAPSKPAQTTSSNAMKGEQVVAGPFRAIDTKVKSEFTAQQSNYLSEFKQTYIAKTAKSQAFNEEHRRYYADPRTVMGFKQAWKDLTYTLVGESSKGSRVIDIDGNEYVDCMSGFGAIYFGHSPDFVQDAVKKQMDKTLDYGPQSQLAGPTAKMICELTGMERASFCNTGSEAVLAAIRISRTVTGNDLIVTFSGDYHGIFDEVLVKSQNMGGKQRNIPVAPGIPESSNQHILVLEYGDPVSIEIIKERAHEIAAVLIEPVQSRRPELQPKKFLQDLRAATLECNIPMIFDEIITGFRLHQKGAQGWFDVDVDIACYGKVIGGGYPVGVIAGKRKYLDALDGGAWNFNDDSFPEVGVTYFAGTFIRHPMAIAAVNAVATHLINAGPELQERTNKRAAVFSERVNQCYRERGIPVVLNYFGSVYFPRFLGNPDYEGLYAHHLRHYGAHHIWGGRPGFLTTAHTDEDIDFLVDAFVNAAEAMQRGGFIPEYQEIENQYPWTSQQEELWLAYKMNVDAGLAYNEQVIFKLESNFDLDVLNLAVDKAFNRHESLRAVVAPDQSGLLIRSYMKYGINYHDLSCESDIAHDVDLEKLLKDNIDSAFDLFNGPLIRVMVIDLSAEQSIFSLCASHLVVDGWSLEKIMEEVCGNYTAIIQGRYYDAPTLPKLHDYFVELDTKKSNGDIELAERYWLSRYTNLPPTIELPHDHARPPLKTYKGQRFEYQIQGDVVNQLRSVAKDANSTLFVVLLSAFYLLLNRLSGEDDVVVGIPAAGQPHLGLLRLCTHMVSFLPVRIKSDPALTFSDFVQTVNDEFIEAKDNQDVGYGQLLKVLAIHRDPSRLPLLATCFNMDMPYNEIVFNGIKAQFMATPRGFVKYDLYFNVTDLGDRFSLEIDFNSDLFDRESVDQWVEHYEGILHAISEKGDNTINSLANRMSDKQSKLLSSWNDTAKPYPLDSVTLDSLFEAAAIEHAKNKAVIFEDQTLTFEALNTKVNQLARILIDKGLGLEQPVAIMMDRSEKLPAVLLAVMRAGGAYLPLDPDHPIDRIQFILDEAKVNCVMVDSTFENKIPAGFDCFHVDREWHQLDALGKETVESRAKPNSLAYIIYTSGSTGKPKGVMVEHRSICNRMLWMQESFELDANDRILQKTPYTFDVSVWEFFMPLTTGACLVMARPGGHKEADYLVDTINQYKITLMHFVPSMLSLFILDPNAASCKGLKRVVCSGEALSKEHEQKFLDLLPNVDLYNFYGPTEAAVEVSTWHCNQDKSYGFVPIGRTVANTQLHILDTDFMPVPIGTVGELFIAGVQVARGYVNRPELTAERFISDPFSNDPNARMYRTGDLVRFHDDGVIEYLGRNDFQVKIRGLRIELGEIENVLLAQHGVSQAVVAAKETKGDMSLIAYVVVENANIEREILRKALALSLPDYMVPHHFVFIANMPLTSSGKADRNALLELEVVAVDRDASEADLPSSPDEVYLADLWKQFIDIDEIFMDDNFFDIGGHSLLAAKVSAFVLDDRGIDIPIRAFITSTLGQIVDSYFVDRIGETRNGCSQENPSDEVSEVVPIPESKKRGWISRLFNGDTE